MTSGYDRRARKGDPLPYRLWDNNGVLLRAGDSPRKSESVTSYRSDVSGTRLDSREVDLYGGFLRRESMADYFNPGPRLLAQLEASGLSQESDYVSLTGNGLDNGHPFEKTSQVVNTSLRRTVSYRPNGQPDTVRYSGSPVSIQVMPLGTSAVTRMPFKFGGGSTALQNSFNLSAMPSPSTDRLKSDGTRMLTALAPASPQVSITASLLELLLGLPAIPGTLLSKLSIGGFGDEYLNTVFGLMPTYDDAVKIAKELRDVSLKLHQIRRDEGRRVRRKDKLPVESKSEIFTGSDLSVPQIWVGVPLDQGTRWNDSNPTNSALSRLYGFTEESTYPTVKQLFMSESRYMSFSGSYTYVLPEIPGFSGRLEKYLASMDALLGLSMSAQTTWQIMPWSWLIDWFLDIRQNIAAISVGHDDNHVVNYAYAMETVERQAVAKVTFTGASPISGVTYVSTSLNAVFKRRIRANPYGFVNEQDSGAWGPYRLAILAALGISRA